MGNSTLHKMAVIRNGEVDTTELKGVTIIIANNLGVSVWTKEGALEAGLTGYAWLIKANTAVVKNLKLVSDKPGHYMLCPTHNMPIEKYKGLLEEMGIECDKYLKFKKNGIIERVA